MHVVVASIRSSRDHERKIQKCGPGTTRQGPHDSQGPLNLPLRPTDRPLQPDGWARDFATSKIPPARRVSDGEMNRTEHIIAYERAGSRRLRRAVVETGRNASAHRWLEQSLQVSCATKGAGSHRPALPSTPSRRPTAKSDRYGPRPRLLGQSAATRRALPAARG